MKHRLKYIAVLIGLVLVILFPSINAYMIKQDEEDNQFVSADVSCKVLEVFDGTNKTSVKVKNTSNTPVYIRVKLVHHWLDSKGDVVGKQSELMLFDNNKNTDVSLSQNNSWLNSNWIAINGVYYYKTPISVGEQTSDLLNSGFMFVIDDEAIKDGDVTFEYCQVLEVHAEAIQALPEEAVKNSWNVNVDSGKIVNN